VNRRWPIPGFRDSGRLPLSCPVNTTAKSAHVESFYIERSLYVNRILTSRGFSPHDIRMGGKEKGLFP